MRQDYFIPKLCGIEKLDATHFTVLFLRAKPNYILKTHSISPKPFTDKQKLREFSTTKPALQQRLKKLLQTGNTREGKDLQ